MDKLGVWELRVDRVSFKREIRTVRTRDLYGKTQ